MLFGSLFRKDSDFYRDLTPVMLPNELRGKKLTLLRDARIGDEGFVEMKDFTVDKDSGCWIDGLIKLGRDKGRFNTVKCEVKNDGIHIWLSSQFLFKPSSRSARFYRRHNFLPLTGVHTIHE